MWSSGRARETKKRAVESKHSCNRRAARSTPPLQRKDFPSGDPSSSASQRPDDSSSTTALHSECAVVWSNAAYRSETIGSSSSSSERRPGLKGSWSSTAKNFSSAGKFAVNVGVIGAVSFGSLTSTRKVLSDDPAFREACSLATPATLQRGVERSFDECWIHGPDRNIEGELLETIVQAELEDENDRRLEEELQSGIAALSKKLADLQCEREEKKMALSDPLSKKSFAAENVSRKKPSNEKNFQQRVRILQKENVGGTRLARSNPEKSRDNVPREKKLVKSSDNTEKKGPTKSRQKEGVTKTQFVEAEKPVRLEEQLKTLRLSPRFWGKTFDWAKSLRSTKAPDRNAPSKKQATASRPVLGEKNRQVKVDATTDIRKGQMKENRNPQAPQGRCEKARSKPANYASKTAKVSRSEEESFSVFTAKLRD
ncbi:hypothetical protein SELMODRAFT_403677 [Selaginella moellendorffii]|uniref:Uncharacterized protein n=1 Tax=Selaginella moellendorffii TaxID=88036 RepID=D8QS65_SELML|nr:uncharacterized protein LOC9630703 [Selaginella moellendorffii]EFJ37390.1 hypothetical protein SELMODRAFT_403677 [Selaginella moellendorffii]|eukprot:XP_002962130.1 uncharacterized protein LOC9630703 [Selaginella moellendorffii]